MTTFIAKNLSDTADFALSVLEVARTTNKHIICLSGDLGAGKTTLAKYLICKFLHNSDLHITSPTFPIVNVYKNGNSTANHFDLYRIRHESELYAIGFDELIRDFSVIEWPEIASAILDSYTKSIINIKITHENKGRKFEF